MFVKRLDDLRAAGAEKVLCGGKARTVRFLTAADGMGFTLSDVRIAPGMDQMLWYKNHWEANYVVSGRGTLEETKMGKSSPLEAGVIYSVGPKDLHRIVALDDIHIISIFNPPLSGNEAHDADGAYQATGRVPPGRGTMFVRHLTNCARRAAKKPSPAARHAPCVSSCKRTASVLRWPTSNLPRATATRSGTRTTGKRTTF